MKKPAKNDEMQTPLKKTGAGKKINSTTRKTNRTSAVNPDSKKAPAKSGLKKTNPTPVKPKTPGRKPGRPPSKTTKTTPKGKTSRSIKPISTKEPEGLDSDEWNSMEMDDFTDEVYDETIQLSEPQSQQLKREELVGELLQDILPDEIPTGKKTTQSQTKPPDEEHNKVRITRNTIAGSSTKRNRFSKPLGQSLLGKTWGIKGMFALVIIFTFLLVNHFAFNEKNSQTAIESLASKLPTYQGVITNTNQGTEGFNFEEAEESSQHLPNPKEDITEGEALAIALERPFPRDKEIKPDQEISKRGLNFWQNLAKTSSEEIAEIQLSLANLRDTPHEEVNNMDLGEIALLPKTNSVIDLALNSEMAPRVGDILKHDGNSVPKEPQLELSWQRESSNPKKSLVDVANSMPLVANVGMQEKIAIPNINKDKNIPSVVFDSERPIPESLAFRHDGSTGVELILILQTISNQMVSLNNTTSDILNILRDTKPTFKVLAAIPEQAFLPLQNDLQSNLAEKFRISDFPDSAKTANVNNLTKVEVTKPVEAHPKNVDVLATGEVLANSELEEDQLFPLLRTPSDEQLVIRSLSKSESGYAALNGVLIGDDVPVFGVVLNIREDDNGRLIVMENGIVYLN